MDIEEFRRVLITFAEEHSDVEVTAGRVTAQIREDIIEARLAFDQDHKLIIVENDRHHSARSWILNRVARLPQLADRILSSLTKAEPSEVVHSFVSPSGTLTPDVATQLPDEPILDLARSLEKVASSPLPGATSVVYLTSDAGEGKTTIISRVSEIRARAFKATKSGPLIVPIPLSGRAFLTFDDAVIAALVNKFRFNYLYFDSFIELVRIGAIVPAFDGYEEMLVEGTKGEAVSALGNFIQGLDSSGCLIVAARKAFFEYLSFKTQARLLDAIGDRSASFSRLAISRWTKKQFCEYGELRNVPDSNEIYQTVSSRLGENHPLLTRAVLIRRLFDVVSDKENLSRLVDLLGTDPQDYFYTFVDAIVAREANEKWLARVSGDIMEPLLLKEEHHELLANIALEMWQSSTLSLRYDVVDAIVDLYSESRKKSASAQRQIRERIKQHSLLMIESNRTLSLSFDHEDFQNFYLGEALGNQLIDASAIDVRSTLSAGAMPTPTLEQSIQKLRRNNSDTRKTLSALDSINRTEPPYSYARENCGQLAIRLSEAHFNENTPESLTNMYFGVNSLCGRNFNHISFSACHFQPTIINDVSFVQATFDRCQFERLEIADNQDLSSWSFRDCTIDCLVLNGDEQSYDPDQICEWLSKLGATFDDNEQVARPPDSAALTSDDRMKILERFLRTFTRSTFVDESFIRLRIGRQNQTKFFDEMLPSMQAFDILEEVPWKGQGTQRRYKLQIPMAELSDALEKSRTFDDFLLMIR